MLRYSTYLIAFLFSLNICAQDTIIEFDRPGAADLPFLVPLKTLQIESGYSMGWDDLGNVGFDTSPSFLLRYSPLKRFELRLAINYMPMSTHFARGYANNNFYGLGLGGKFKICKQKKLRPELAIEGLFTVPVPTVSTTDPLNVGGEIYLLSNNYFTKWFYLNLNVGYVYGGPKLNHSLAYSSCFGFELGQYIEMFIEHFAFFHSNDEPDFGVDGGICIYPTPRFQIDLSYIRIFNGLSNGNSLSFGLSYNIGLHKDHYKNMHWRK